MSELFLTGANVLSNVNTSSQSTGGNENQGTISVTGGTTTFEADDFIVFSTLNETPQGELDGTSAFDGIIVYETYQDYLDGVAKYTYTPQNPGQTAGIQSDVTGLGDSYVRLNANVLVSSDAGAPSLNSLMLTPDIDWYTTDPSSGQVINHFTDHDFNESGSIETTTTEDSNGLFSASDWNTVVLAAQAPPSDFIVSGTSGDDLIDAAYVGDPEGDMVDANDAANASQDDVIEAGAGNDTVLAGDGSDSVSGGDGNDFIYGGYGNDTLDGGDGDDTLNGFGGNTSLIGGAGNDYLYASSGSDTLEGGTGNDSLNGGNGNDSLFGGQGDDVFISSSGNDSSDGGDDADTFRILDGSLNDTIVGGEGGTDDDLIDLSGVTTGVTVTFSDEEDGTIIDGADTITFSEIEELSLTAQADSVDASLTHAGLTGDAPGIIVNAAGGDDTVLGGRGGDTIDGGTGADSIEGDYGDDSLAGGDGDDWLDGGLGNDTLLGGGGNDTILAGYEADVFDGGDDVDTYLIDGSPVQQFAFDINLQTGTDTFGNTYANIENIIAGDGDDTLTGDGADNLLDGGDGADSFIALDGFGNDTIGGGEGGTDSDTIDLSALTGPVTVTYTGDEAGTITDGIDTITFSEIENLILTDQADTVDASADTLGVNIDGGRGGDSIRGGSGNDTITGHGHDTVYGGAGDDSISNTSSSNASLSGGSGNDTIQSHNASDVLDGGDGNDLIVDTGASGSRDTITGGAGDDTINAGDGNDSVDGGADNDNIDGGAGDDSLTGGGGVDSVSGGTGDDSIDGGFGTDVLDGGDGNDTVSYLDSFGNPTAETLDLDLEAGTALLNGSQNEIATNFENATSGDTTDTITGTSGANEISSGGGNDLIDGAAGDDTLDGGSGNDSLTGGAGSDSIDGGTGSDTLDGGSGADTLTGGAGNDTFTYTPGDGIDTITDFNTGNTGALNDGDNTNNDSIDLSGFYDSIFELHADQADDGVLNQSNTTGPDAVDYSNNDQFAPGEGITFQGASADNSSFTSENTGVVCFTTGTAIRTPHGDVLIDDLKVGEWVTTLDNGPQRIAWIGQRHVAHSELSQNDRLHPVFIKKGVLGAERDLLVSRQHGMLLGQDHFGRAVHLAKTMPGIRVAKGKRQVTYVHLMFEAHQIIFAEGIPSESFYPGPMALEMLSNASRKEMRLIFPKLTAGMQHEDTIAAYGDTARVFLENKKALSAWLSTGTDAVEKEIRKLDVDLAMEQFEAERMYGTAAPDQIRNSMRQVA